METATERPQPLTRLAGDEQAFRSKVREFAEVRVRPLVMEMDREAELRPGLVAELFSEGLMGIEVPAAYGGAGGTFFQTVLAIEELARVDPAVAVFVHVQSCLVANAVRRWGTPEQCRRYLPRLATGSVGANALSEEQAGSDSFALSTRARPDGDAFVLDGRKLWVSNGAEADLFLVFADTTPERAAQKSLSVFLVERSSPGLTVGRREDKMGIRANSTCEVLLEGVRVPRDNVLGQAGAGQRLAVEILNEGRIGIGAQMAGLAQGALEAATAYAQSRRQFGQPIATFQGVQFPLADVATQVEAARLLVYNAARLRENGAPPLELLRTSAMAKYFAAQVAEHAASQAVEVFGGRGYIRDYPAEKFYRDAKIGKIYEGTSNMQLRTIAYTLFEASRG